MKTPPLLVGAWLLLAASGYGLGHGRGGPLLLPIVFVVRAFFAAMMLLVLLLLALLLFILNNLD